MSSGIEIVTIAKQDAAQLAILLEEHLRELGAPTDYPYFAAYWSEVTRHPYFISSAGQSLGFALVREPGDGVEFEMAEFYVRPSERRQRIGQTAVALILHRLPGRWRIPVARGNKVGVLFWSRVLGVPPRDAPEERVVFEVESFKGAVGAV